MKAAIHINAGLHSRIKAHVANETLKPGKEKLKVYAYVEGLLEKGLAADVAEAAKPARKTANRKP